MPHRGSQFNSPEINAANGVNAQDEFLDQSTLFVICYDHFLSCCSVCCRSSCVASGARVAPYCVRAGRYTMWRPSPFAERYYVETITLRRARLYGDPHSAQSSTVDNVEILTGAPSATVWRPSPDAELYYVGDPQFAQSATIWRPSLCAGRHCVYWTYCALSRFVLTRLYA
jgi:hypothetical protein